MATVYNTEDEYLLTVFCAANILRLRATTPFLFWFYQSGMNSGCMVK